MMRVLPNGRTELLTPRVDHAKLDATSEKDIAQHQADDEMSAALEAGAYVRGVRSKLRLSQVEFARRLNIPVDTLRNWEQGKRGPQGPARALLRIIDKAPEAALRALEGE